MSQQQNPFAQSRAAEVWLRFAGLFGGDSLKRKFGASPPEEWVGCLAKLDPRELERGMRRLVHSGRDQVPTLPAFLRLCRAVGDDSIEEGERSPALPNPDRPRGDIWEACANRHLQAHITRRICHRGMKYVEADMEILVRAKSAWAADMRDQAAHQPDGAVDPTFQRTCWEDYIVRAEQQIAANAGSASA